MALSHNYPACARLCSFVCVCVGASYNCANQTMGRMCLPLPQRQESGNTFLWLLSLTNKLKSYDSKNVCTKWVLLCSLVRLLSASSAQLELWLGLGLWLGAPLNSTRLPLAKFKLLLLRFCSWLHFILVVAAAAADAAASLAAVAAAAAVAVDDDFPFCAQVFFVVCTNSFLSPLP